jgi:hypothetical protein
VLEWRRRRRSTADNRQRGAPVSDLQSTPPRPTGWIGWIMFAAALLIVNGCVTAIQGLAGIFRDEEYFRSGGGDVLVLDLTAWGWIHLILGVLLVVIGVLLVQGSGFARGVAIVLVALHMIAQFSWLGAYPFWALILIVLDMLILNALVVHGAEMKTE